MHHLVQQIQETTRFLENQGIVGANTAIILGTGLHHFISLLEIEKEIPYTSIPHFATTTVEFHKGKLVLGKMGDTKVIVLQGRFHYYEGYSMQQVTFPVRILKALGVSQLLISNAAGGMNIKYKKGDLVLLKDHINLLPENPLRGLHDPALGNRFVDMSCPYDLQLNRKIKKSATAIKLKLKSGTYVAVQGPNLETRAEYRYLQAAGADMVGMSTVPEVIVANQIGLACAAISVITDECDPDHLQRVNIAEIIEVAGKADKKLSALFQHLMLSMHSTG